MSFVATRDRLVTLLETLEGIGQPLKDVFGWFNPQPKKFPCAMVVMTGGSSEARLDSASNELEMRFVIRILDVLENTSDSEDRRLTIVDSLLDMLRGSNSVDTLGGTVEKFDVIEIVPIEDNGQDAPRVGFDIVVRAVKIKTIGL